MAGPDADVDPEIRRQTLGHADQAMTSHYTNIEAQALGLVAEADGNRTRRRRGAPPTSFEDQGGHQAPRRLRDQTLPPRQGTMAGRAAAVLRQSRSESAGCPGSEPG